MQDIAQRTAAGWRIPLRGRPQETYLFAVAWQGLFCDFPGTKCGSQPMESPHSTWEKKVKAQGVRMTSLLTSLSMQGVYRKNLAWKANLEMKLLGHWTHLIQRIPLSTIKPCRLESDSWTITCPENTWMLTWSCCSPTSVPRPSETHTRQTLLQRRSPSRRLAELKELLFVLLVACWSHLWDHDELWEDVRGHCLRNRGLHLPCVKTLENVLCTCSIYGVPQQCQHTLSGRNDGITGRKASDCGNARGATEVWSAERPREGERFAGDLSCALNTLGRFVEIPNKDTDLGAPT